MKTDQEVKQAILDIVSSLIEGGGEEPGIGQSTEATISMTAASECIWGTSGRGNPNAKAKIRAAASFGFVRVIRRGRTERVGLTDRGITLYNESVKQ